MVTTHDVASVELDEIPYDWGDEPAELRLAYSAPAAEVAAGEQVRRPRWQATCKRSVDVVLATVLLVSAIPVLVIAAIAIRLDSSGPVFFRQDRAGWHGQPFRILKLRTMVADAEDRLAEILDMNDHDGPQIKVTNDPRVTPVGRTLRALSVDELPQLWNVIRGDMSLVGPRPAPLYEAENWPDDAHRRLAVRPGLTGPWQVSGRSDLSFEDYVRHDLDYVDHWSPWRDMTILARTIPAVVARRGAH